MIWKIFILWKSTLQLWSDTTANYLILAWLKKSATSFGDETNLFLLNCKKPLLHTGKSETVNVWENKIEEFFRRSNADILVLAVASKLVYSVKLQLWIASSCFFFSDSWIL